MNMFEELPEYTKFEMLYQELLELEVDNIDTVTCYSDTIKVTCRRVIGSSMYVLDFLVVEINNFYTVLTQMVEKIDFASVTAYTVVREIESFNRMTIAYDNESVVHYVESKIGLYNTSVITII